MVEAVLKSSSLVRLHEKRLFPADQSQTTSHTNLLFPWLPRRHWAAQPMKLRLATYKGSL